MKDHRSPSRIVLSRWVFPSILCLISFTFSFLAAFSTIRWLQAPPSQPVLFHMQTVPAATHTSQQTSKAATQIETNTMKDSYEYIIKDTDFESYAADDDSNY